MWVRILMSIILLKDLSGSLWAKNNRHDTLVRTQKTLSRSLAAQKVRTRVAAENMANSSSPNYIPKEVRLQAKQDHKNNTTDVKVHSIYRNKKKTKQVYDPQHPQADETGMLTMPDNDPLLNYMDLQQAKIVTELMQKSYQLTTEMRHHTLKMMN